MNDASAGVRLTGLTKQFGPVTAVAPLDLDVRAGEFVVLVGPSGCGKTTILRMIAGLEEPSGGTIAIGDRDVTEVEPADRNIAMVFQNYALYPHMTVEANLAFGLKMRRTPADDIARRVDRASQVLGLDGLLDRRPGQLSGGQRQRVALGRAIVRDPRVFLFDEPLSNLDARLRAEMRRELKDLHRRLGATMIFVTHDQVEAMTLGDRIAVLNDGVLQQYDTPLEVYRRPANLFVATFVGTPEINTASGQADRRSGGQERRGGGQAVRDADEEGDAGVFRCGAFTLSLNRDLPATGTVLAVRPEDLTLMVADAAECDVTVEVDRLEPLGNELLVHVTAEPDLRWAVRARSDWQGRAGDRVGLHVDPSRVHVFNAETGERI